MQKGKLCLLLFKLKLQAVHGQLHLMFLVVEFLNLELKGPYLVICWLVTLHVLNQFLVFLQFGLQLLNMSLVLIDDA